MADTVRAHVYFRRKGESDYRDLGFIEMGSVPSKGGRFSFKIYGRTVEARVVKVNEFKEPEHRPAPEPIIWLETI